MLKVYQYLVKRRKLLFLYMFVMLCVFAWGLLLWEVPTEIYVLEGEKIEIEEKLPVKFEQDETAEVFANRWSDNYQVTCSFLGVIPIKNVTVHVVEQKEVIPVGETVGMLVNTSGVYVVDTDEIETQSGENVELCIGLIESGDYILKVNGEPVSEKEDVMEAVEKSCGDIIEFTLRRDDETVTCKVAPVLTNNQTYKLGIWIKDDMAGVGTITYIDADGNYGALGHGISSSETEKLIEITGGKLYETEIAAVNKGEKGAPGSLVGLVYSQIDHYLGTIDSNTSVGIYGTLENVPEELTCAEALPVAYKQEVRTGAATILADVDGVIQSYDIEIEDIVMNNPELNKSILIRVTDEALIQKTGGIVQGLSGSPIIQDGKLVGAVTHVLVNDPTRGYGIFIENMLETSG